MILTPAIQAGDAPWMAHERDRIASERTEAQQIYDAAHKACWQRFAVNSCQKRARTALLNKTDLLRREERVLDDLSRCMRTERKKTAQGKDDDRK